MVSSHMQYYCGSISLSDDLRRLARQFADPRVCKPELIEFFEAIELDIECRQRETHARLFPHNGRPYQGLPAACITKGHLDTLFDRAQSIKSRSADRRTRAFWSAVEIFFARKERK